MAGLMDAARSISSSLGLIASSAQATAKELTKARKAKAEYDRRDTTSSMARAAGGAASTMGASGGSGSGASGITPGAVTAKGLTAAIASVTGRTS